jgi:hypothetical protein
MASETFTEEPGYDLFLSYNPADRSIVESIAQRLRDAGLRPFLDRWYLTAGARWLPQLEKALNSCKAFAIVDVAFDLQSKSPNFPVIPVLLPGCEPPLGFLSQLASVDLRSQVLDEGIAILIKAAQGEPPGPDLLRRKLLAFLCHSSHDKMAVRKLYQQLIHDDFSAWFDEEDLIPGQEWDTEIRKAVRASDVVVVCLSRSSITKEGYVQKEIRYALDVAAEKPPGIIFLIPARLDECEVPERLKGWQWVDLYKDKGYERLLKALRKRGEALGLVVPAAK